MLCIGALLKVLFGWREIFVTMDSQAYHQIKGKLTQSGIKHLTEINNPSNGSSHRSLAVRDFNLNTYYLYVKANDVEKARSVINI